MAKKPTPPKTLAEKIDYLFKVVHPPGKEYSREEVVTAIRDAGGPTLSATYLWQLRKGERDNPTKRHLEALASFFGVPPAYFFDDETTEAVTADLETLTALRDPDAREIVRLAHGLSPETLGTMKDMLRRARQLEGLEDLEPARTRKRR